MGFSQRYSKGAAREGEQVSNKIADMVKDVRDKAFTLASKADRALQCVGSLDDVDTAMVDMQTSIQTLMDLPAFWEATNLNPTEDSK